jgi:hypothetical protein
LDQLLTLVEERWKHMLGLIAEEHDPAHLRAMIVELNGILEERRKGSLPKASEIPGPRPKDTNPNDRSP